MNNIKAMKLHVDIKTVALAIELDDRKLSESWFITPDDIEAVIGREVQFRQDFFTGKLTACVAIWAEHIGVL